jgi:hypothetical protein
MPQTRHAILDAIFHDAYCLRNTVVQLGRHEQSYKRLLLKQ